MSTRRATHIVWFVQAVALSLLVAGCDLGVSDWIDVFFGDGKDICFLRRWPSRCEGDVLIECPGGWMTIDAKMHPTDCRARDQYCVSVDLNGHAQPFCMDSKGDCDAGTFSSYCEPYEGDEYGRMTTCERGKIIAAGVQCRLSPTTRSEAAPATTPSP